MMLEEAKRVVAAHEAEVAMNKAAKAAADRALLTVAEAQRFGHVVVGLAHNLELLRQSFPGVTEAAVTPLTCGCDCGECDGPHGLFAFVDGDGILLPQFVEAGFTQRTCCGCMECFGTPAEPGHRADSVRCRHDR